MPTKRNYPFSILLTIVAILVLLFAWSCEKEDPLQPATLNTLSVNNITINTAQSGGNITSDGGGDITSRGVVWSTSSNPTVEQNNGITMEGSGPGLFQSNITGLQSNTIYYLRAYATNEKGIVYGNEQQFTTIGTVPTVTTSSVIEITQSTATGGGIVTADGGPRVTDCGLVWSTSQNPTLETNSGIIGGGSGTGSFTSIISGLTVNTTYYVKAYATNSTGTGYGQKESFSSKDSSRDTETQLVEVINPATGKIWMDRNLGASRAATTSTDEEAYGHLYQWGRAADGHQLRTSASTPTSISSDTPGHGDFILTDWPDDWLSPQNHNLWQGLNGVNNPCPSGFRLPTEAELNEERQSWSSNNAAGAFASPLKLPVAGLRYFFDGSLISVGSYGYYWSSTAPGLGSRLLHIENGMAIIDYR